MTEMKDNANTVGRPPVFMIGALALGAVLHILVPVDIVSGLPTWVAGIPLAAIALGLFGLAQLEFRRHGTPVSGTEPVTTIVGTGLYRFSRNPIYLSFILLQLGIALTANSLWILLVAVPTVFYLSLGVIAREETYLARKFGEQYLRYRASVRRWL